MDGWIVSIYIRLMVKNNNMNFFLGRGRIGGPKNIFLLWSKKVSSETICIIEMIDV